MSNTLSTEKPTEQPQREQDSSALPCSLTLLSAEGTITVTRHPDGKATIEMFDQRTIRDLIDKEDRIKLAEFLSENKEVWKWWLHNKRSRKWRRCNDTPDYPTKEEAMRQKPISCGEDKIPVLLRESEDCFTAFLERSQTIDRTTASP